MVEDDEKFREKFDEKKNLAKEFAEKRSEYAEIVRENYKPRVREHSKLQKIPEEKVYRSMSHAEMHHRGNDYMKSVNERFKDRTHAKTIFRKSEDKPFKYRNYLTEIRIKKAEEQKGIELEERMKKNMHYQKEIQQILSKPDMSEGEKFLRAKLATKKM